MCVHIYSTALGVGKTNCLPQPLDCTFPALCLPPDKTVFNLLTFSSPQTDNPLTNLPTPLSLTTDPQTPCITPNPHYRAATPLNPVNPPKSYQPLMDPTSLLDPTHPFPKPDLFRSGSQHWQKFVWLAPDLQSHCLK